MSRTFILTDFYRQTASTKTTGELATAAARIGDVTAVVLAPGRQSALQWLPQ